MNPDAYKKEEQWKLIEGERKADKEQKVQNVVKENEENRTDEKKEEVEEEKKKEREAMIIRQKSK